MTITKTEIIEKLQIQNVFSNKESIEAVDSFLEILKTTLESVRGIKNDTSRLSWRDMQAYL